MLTVTEFAVPRIGIAALAIALALTGCAAGAGGAPGEPPAPPAPPAAPAAGLADCLVGRWRADLPDLARQMTDDFAVDPIAPDTSARVAIDGEQYLTLTDAAGVSWGGPVNYEVVALDGDGLSLEVTVETSGEITGSWSASGDTLTLSDVDKSFWTTTTRVAVNGEPLADASSFDGLIDSSISNGSMTVSCADDSLLTQPAGGFLTQWTRLP